MYANTIEQIVLKLDKFSWALVYLHRAPAKCVFARPFQNMGCP